MGLVQKLSKANLRPISISLRRKPKAPATPPAEITDQKWEFRVTSNPKEYSDEFNIEVATPGTSEITATESNEATVNSDAVEPAGWGWIMSTCWGSRSIQKTDDRTFESSCDDDGTGESSQPSVSMVDQVLDVSTAVDDVSDVTSAPSIDDESGSEESQSQ